MSTIIVRSEPAGKSLVMRVESDHIDASNVADFRGQSTNLLQGATRVVLDLTGVTFIDSAGLGAILSIMRGIGERRGDFRVCSVSKPIRVLFELVRLHKILDIHETREEALARSSEVS